MHKIETLVFESVERVECARIHINLQNFKATRTELLMRSGTEGRVEIVE